jgi:hypothetical protein
MGREYGLTFSILFTTQKENEERYEILTAAL